MARSVPSDWICVVLLAALTLGGALGGARSIPLDAHEVYVAQTAENMIASGDWIVPRLNDELRLSKPPLSYWATAAVALARGHRDVAPTDVRLPSILAGLGLVLLVFAMGRGERNTATGLLAGVIALSSLAFFRYTHDGRPDMLYAFLAAVMVWAFWAGGRDRAAWAPDRMRVWALLFWVAFALDTLTKGPQFGAVILAACVIHGLALERDRRRLYARLRPLQGLIVLGAITLPWWWLLDVRIGPQLKHSQLSGSLLSIEPLRLLSSYYWLHAPLQWAPWLLAIVPAAVVAWTQRRGAAGLFALIVLLPIIVFTMGPQYREIYMLPSLGCGALLLAFGIDGLTGSPRPAARYGFWGLFVFMAVFVVGGVAWLVSQATSGWLSVILRCGVAVALVMLAIYRVGFRAPHDASRRLGALTLIGMAVGVALMQAAATPEVWSPSRYRDRALALRLSGYRDQSMAVFDRLAPEVFVYYLDRPIATLRNIAALCAWIGENHAAQPLLLYRPAQAQDVETALPGMKRVMQSPGSKDSAVIVARVNKNNTGTCGARSQ